MSDLELEARLRCDHCDAAPYLLYRRRNRQADGSPLQSYESVLWPADASVVPPTRAEKITCPDCHRELRRVAA